MGDTVVGEIDESVLERYDIKRRIGKGAYGIVWKAVERTSNHTVAVKKIFDAFKNKTDAQRTYREVIFLRSFGHHPNVIKLLNVLKADNDLDLYLVFEHMDSDLHDVIKRGNILKDIHKRYIMYQLLSALKCLHSMKVIHRDLKPSNILLDVDCSIRVADFGLARSLLQLQDDEHGDPPLTEYVATRWYRAPEILLADKIYTTGVDIWSAGCILGEMLFGKPLFPGTSTLNQIERIMCAIPQPTFQDVKGMCSGYALTLLERAINRPKRPLRDMIPNASDDSIDMLSKLLLFNPNKRLSAEQALSHPYLNRFKGSSAHSCSSNLQSSFKENRKLSIHEYREKVYQVIKENYCPNHNIKINQNEKFEEFEKCKLEKEDDAIQNEELVDSGCDIPDETVTSRRHSIRFSEPVNDSGNELANIGCNESPPFRRVGRWLVSDASSRNGIQIDRNGCPSTLRTARSQDYLPSPDDVQHSVEIAPASFPSAETNQMYCGRQPAGLPSSHPRANTASAWLRYHWPVIKRDPTIPKTPNKVMPLLKEKTKPTFGRKQFSSCANVSSLGCPKVEMHSYSQNQGTIAASALHQLKLSN